MCWFLKQKPPCSAINMYVFQEIQENFSKYNDCLGTAPLGGAFCMQRLLCSYKMQCCMWHDLPKIQWCYSWILHRCFAGTKGLHWIKDGVHSFCLEAQHIILSPCASRHQHELQDRMAKKGKSAAVVYALFVVHDAMYIDMLPLCISADPNKCGHTRCHTRWPGSKQEMLLFTMQSIIIYMSQCATNWYYGLLYYEIIMCMHTFSVCILVMFTVVAATWAMSIVQEYIPMFSHHAICTNNTRVSIQGESHDIQFLVMASSYVHIACKGCFACV